MVAGPRGVPVEPCEAATTPIPIPIPKPTVPAISNGITREIERTPTPLCGVVSDCTPCRPTGEVGTEPDVWGDLPRFVHTSDDDGHPMNCPNLR